MRIAVIGAGAIGTYYTARLAAAGNAVTLVARREEDAEVIRRSGIRVTGLEESVCTVEAVSRLESVEPGTLVLLATKVYDTPVALGAAAHLLGPDAVVLCLQNGLDAEGVARAAAGDRCPVLRGITDFGVVFVGPGEVSLRARGPTVVEGRPPGPAIADLFARAGLNGRVADDIRREVWRKLVVNCVINPLTAMTGMEVGWASDARLDPLKQRIVDECAAVARCDGTALDDDLLPALNERYAPSRNLSSMHQDLLRGRPTEIDAMNGAVVELGRRHGVPCPVNESLAAIVRSLEAASRRR